MPGDKVELIRRTYEAYSRGDLETMLGFVDPNVQWTYLDPNLPDPEPQVCWGRQEVEAVLKQCLNAGLLDEIRVDLIPVLLGDGIRFFDNLKGTPIYLDGPRVIEGAGVTHLHYRIR